MQEKQSKKCNVKNQHYVPQFYLKNFSKDKKNIGVFVIENCKYVASASIKHQSSEDYFYSENPDIERDLGALERDAKIVIDTISGNPKVKLNSKNAYTLYLFTMIQQGRTLANEIITRLHKKDDLFIPQYEEIFKNVLSRYQADFREEGRHSYEYKLQSGRIE